MNQPLQSKRGKIWRVGIVTAMWQRPELTDCFFTNINAIKQSISSFMELVPAVAGSEGDASKDLAKQNGFLYQEIENLPLGAKWNAALSLLREKEIDGVVIIGSDDLINERYFHVLHQFLENGAKLLGLDTFYVLEGRSGRLMEWLGYLPPREGESVGAGRFLHRELLERLQWHLWEDQLNGGLDASMWRKLARDAATRGQEIVSHTIKCRAEGIVLVDVKTWPQINSLSFLAVQSGKIRFVPNADAFLKKYFPQPIYQKIGKIVQLKNRDEGEVEVLLDPISPLKITSDVKTYVLTPQLPLNYSVASDYHQLSLLTKLCLKGNSLELWANAIADNEHAKYKIDSGLRNVKMQDFRSALNSLPDTMEHVVVCGAWKNSLQIVSILRRLRRQFNKLKITLDSSLLGQEIAAALIPMVDEIIGSGDAQIPDYKLPFVDYALRDSAVVLMEHANAEEDIVSLAHACVGDKLWMRINEQLFLVYDKTVPDELAKLKIYACKAINMQICYRIFKVCILPPHWENREICREILAAKTPVLCYSRLYETLAEKSSAIMPYATWEEALSLVYIFCQKEHAWLACWK